MALKRKAFVGLAVLLTACSAQNDKPDWYGYDDDFVLPEPDMVPETPDDKPGRTVGEMLGGDPMAVHAVSGKITVNKAVEKPAEQPVYEHAGRFAEREKIALRKGLNAPDSALIYSAKKRAPETEVRPLEVKNTIEKDELVVKSEQEMLAAIISPKPRELKVVEVVKTDAEPPAPAPKTDDAEIDLEFKPDTQALIEPRKQDVVLEESAPEPERKQIALVEPVKSELLQPLVPEPVKQEKPVLKLTVPPKTEQKSAFALKMPPKQTEKPALTLKAPEPEKPAFVLKMPEAEKPPFTLKEPVAENAFKQEIGKIGFKGSSDVLSESAKAVVREAVDAWNDNSIAVLSVEHMGGYLAEKRAKAVADALKRAGAEQVEISEKAGLSLNPAVTVYLVY